MPVFLPLALLFLASALWAQPVAGDAYAPMTGSERWQHYGEDNFASSTALFRTLGRAVGSHISNEPPEWRQGMAGYGRRSASAFGQYTMQGTIRDSMAAALRYDVRYHPSGQGGKWRRIGYAIQMTAFTRNAEGNKRLDIARFSGLYGSTMISTYWYPDRYRPWKEGVRWGSQNLGFETGFNILREFKPELRRFFLHR
jgi:hypothetical protein